MCLPGAAQCRSQSSSAVVLNCNTIQVEPQEIKISSLQSLQATSKWMVYNYSLKMLLHNAEKNMINWDISTLHEKCPGPEIFVSNTAKALSPLSPILSDGRQPQRQHRIRVVASNFEPEREREVKVQTGSWNSETPPVLPSRWRRRLPCESTSIRRYSEC